MKEHDKRKNLFKLLSNYVNKGISLLLMGRPVTPAQAVKTILELEGSFMADFVYDENGFLREISYDRVRFA